MSEARSRKRRGRGLVSKSDHEAEYVADESDGEGRDETHPYP